MADPLPLWDGPAPGALGATPADVPTLTPWLHPRGGERPCLVVLPGGAYGQVSEREAAPIARWANQIGLHAVTVRYRVKPYQAPWPMADGLRAIRIVRARAEAWGIRAGQVAVIGFSAGGHLAATTAVFHDQVLAPDDLATAHSARPDALLLAYPVITGGAGAHAGSFANLGATTPEARDRWSIERHVRADMPPTWLWHGCDDKPVPVTNALVLVEAMHRLGLDITAHLFARSGPHGFSNGFDRAPGNPADIWPDLAAHWFRGLGWIG
jgi:acetyl esterase/lipase